MTDGSDGQRTLLPSDGGDPRCWPTDYPRHGEGARDGPGGGTGCQSSYNVPRKAQGAELLPKPVQPGPGSQGTLKPVGKSRTELIEDTVIGQCVVWEENGMVSKFKEWIDH